MIRLQDIADMAGVSSLQNLNFLLNFVYVKDIISKDIKK